MGLVVTEHAHKQLSEWHSRGGSGSGGRRRRGSCIATSQHRRLGHGLRSGLSAAAAAGERLHNFRVAGCVCICVCMRVWQCMGVHRVWWCWCEGGLKVGLVKIRKQASKPGICRQQKMADVSVPERQQSHTNYGAHGRAQRFPSGPQLTRATASAMA